jgi:hypothetical protein
LKDGTRTHAIFGDVGGLKNKQEESIDNPLINTHEEVKADG